MAGFRARFNAPLNLPPMSLEHSNKQPLVVARADVLTEAHIGRLLAPFFQTNSNQLIVNP
jgi:hypothetical protein